MITASAGEPDQGMDPLGRLLGFLVGLLLFQGLRRFLLGFFLPVSAFTHEILTS